MALLPIGATTVAVLIAVLDRREQRTAQLCCAAVRSEYLRMRVTRKRHSRFGPRKGLPTTSSNLCAMKWQPRCRKLGRCRLGVMSAASLRLAHLFDDLVGAGEQCWRNGQFERLGGHQVD